MSWFVLFGTEGLAVITDLLWRKIPNQLVLSGTVLGIILRISTEGISGLKEGILGGSLAFLLLGFLHFFKMLGAGDIKLLMMTGIFLGPVNVCRQILLTLVIAGAISAVVLVRYRILGRRLAYFTAYMKRFWETGKWEPYIQEEDDKAYLHVSIPILLGSILLRLH